MTTVLRIVHLLSATVWVGGTIALVFVGVPAIRATEGEARAVAMRALGRRWRPLGWGALAVLAATGAANAYEHGAFSRAGTGFDAVLAVKVGLFVVLVITAYLHDFVLGPGLARQIREGRTQTIRPRLVVVGWVSFALTLAIPVLGVALAELAG